MLGLMKENAPMGKDATIQLTGSEIHSATGQLGSNVTVQLTCRPHYKHHRNMKVLAAITLLAIAVVSVASLVSGADYLEFVLPGGLPVGNAVSALGLVCAAVVPVLLSAHGSVLRTAAVVTLGAAIVWLPASTALAGNLELNFTGWRGSVWLGLSLVIHLAVLCTLAWAFIGRLLAGRRRVGAA